MNNINLIPINKSHITLAKELNLEFNPLEKFNNNKFIEFIINIPNNINIYVLKDKDTIIGCGTLMIEKKIIHNFSNVAHIEDVFILPKFRKKGYGKILILKLNEIAVNNNCYKVILNCKIELIDFYLKCGFENKNIQMSKYF